MSNIEVLPPETGKDYILQIKVKNGPLLRAMRIRGFKTASALARAAGTNANSIGEYLMLTSTPLTKTGKWRDTAQKMAHALRLPLVALFPEQHLDRALARSTGELEISREEIELIMSGDQPLDPEQILQQKQISGAIAEAVSTLRPREQRAVELSFGLSGEGAKTLDEIGQELGCSRERVRQIVSKAVRKLQKPAVARKLAEVGLPAAEDEVMRRDRLDAIDARNGLIEETQARLRAEERVAERDRTHAERLREAREAREFLAELQAEEDAERERDKLQEQEARDWIARFEASLGRKVTP